jgi:hypothetical protein
MPPVPYTQVLLYEFGPEARFEGQLVGALERLESGGALRILEAALVQRDSTTGELAAVDLPSNGAGGIAGPLIEFRLNPASRHRTTERALGERAGARGAALRELGEALAPGAAIAAVVIDHVWRRALEDAVSRIGGTPVAGGFVQAEGAADLTSIAAGGLPPAG